MWTEVILEAAPSCWWGHKEGLTRLHTFFAVLRLLDLFPQSFILATARVSRKASGY